MMEDLEKLNAMLDDIHKFINGDEDKRKEIWDALTQFRLIYGNEWISKEIWQIVNGSPREQQKKLGISSLEFHRRISELFSDLRGRILNQMYVHATGNDYAPKIKEAINNINPLFNELGKIYSLVFDNKTTLEEIKNLMESEEFQKTAKIAVKTTDQLEEISSEMEKNKQQIMDALNNGFNHVLALSDGTIELSTERAAELYGVNIRTIQLWKSSKTNNPYWPTGGRATSEEWKRLAGQYKASKEPVKILPYNE